MPQPPDAARSAPRPEGWNAAMNGDFFNRPEYLQFLLDHCTNPNQPSEGRIGGGDITAHHLHRFGFQPGQRVLEVGCGTGRVLAMLADLFGVQPQGVDVCADAVAHLKRTHPRFADHVRCLAPGDLSPFADRSFDAVVYWGVFELVEQRLALLECSRILAPGGRVLVCSIKCATFRDDDAEMAAAVEAYRTKRIPLYLTDVAAFERLAAALGFVIEKRIVFERKKDFITNTCTEDTGGPRAPFSEAIYWLRKQSPSPVDSTVAFLTY